MTCKARRPDTLLRVSHNKKRKKARWTQQTTNPFTRLSFACLTSQKTRPQWKTVCAVWLTASWLNCAKGRTQHLAGLLIKFFRLKQNGLGPLVLTKYQCEFVKFKYKYSKVTLFDKIMLEYFFFTIIITIS